MKIFFTNAVLLGAPASKENLEILEKLKTATGAQAKSLGAKNCTILKKQINAKSLSITVEKNIPTNTNTRMLINYKNIDHLYFTAYKITNDQLYEFNRLYRYITNYR